MKPNHVDAFLDQFAVRPSDAIFSDGTFFIDWQPSEAECSLEWHSRKDWLVTSELHLLCDGTEKLRSASKRMLDFDTPLEACQSGLLHLSRSLYDRPDAKPQRVEFKLHSFLASQIPVASADMNFDLHYERDGCSSARRFSAKLVTSPDESYIDAVTRQQKALYLRCKEYIKSKPEMRIKLVTVWLHNSIPLWKQL